MKYGEKDEEKCEIFYEKAKCKYALEDKEEAVKLLQESVKYSINAKVTLKLQIYTLLGDINFENVYFIIIIIIYLLLNRKFMKTHYLHLLMD